MTDTHVKPFFSGLGIGVAGGFAVTMLGVAMFSGPTYVDTNRATSILTKLGFTGISTSIPRSNRDCGSDGQGVWFYATPPFGGAGARMSGTVCLPKDGDGVVKFRE